jgi:hypothetical protein
MNSDEKVNCMFMCMLFNAKYGTTESDGRKIVANHANRIESEYAKIAK